MKPALWQEGLFDFNTLERLPWNLERFLLAFQFAIMIHGFSFTGNKVNFTYNRIDRNVLFVRIIAEFAIQRFPGGHLYHH